MAQTNGGSRPVKHSRTEAMPEDNGGRRPVGPSGAAEDNAGGMLLQAWPLRGGLGAASASGAH